MKYLLLISTALFAATASAQSYLEAKSAITRGTDISTFDNLSNEPLYPYLAYEFYRKNIDKDTEIIALFNQHYSALPVKKLHNQWIKDNFRRGNLSIITQHYYDTGNTEAHCMYRNALLQLGQREKALEGISRVWLSPQPLSNECDPVFEAWGKANNSHNLVKRAKLAYHAGNARFAGDLGVKSQTVEGNIIQQFANYVRNPTQLLSVSATELTLTELHRELLPKALKRLVRKDSVGYANFAMQFAPMMKTSTTYQSMLSDLTHYLANRQNPQVKQSYALLTHPDKNATESLMRYLVADYDWQGIRDLISPTSKNPMAQYWLGRANAATGKEKAAKKAYEKAAATRSYYGFLAADRLKQPYTFDYQPILPDQETQRRLDRNLSLVRAKQLYQYGDITNARREIFAISKAMNLKTLRQLAYWLNQHGFHHDAIYVLGKAKDWNDIGIRFPTPYTKEVNAAYQRSGTDPTWTYAVIRQESSMNPKAVSRAKAKGLMQLIPPTARRVAKQLDIYLYNNSIFAPAINIQLGAKYLDQMYYRFGSIALASAAYNAGPGRVEKWSQNGVGDLTIWVEKIPFDETRKYVKRILEYQQVYAHHLGKTIPTVTENMQIKARAVLLPTENLTDAAEVIKNKTIVPSSSIELDLDTSIEPVLEIKTEETLEEL